MTQRRCFVRSAPCSRKGAKEWGRAFPPPPPSLEQHAGLAGWLVHGSSKKIPCPFILSTRDAETSLEIVHKIRLSENAHLIPCQDFSGSIRFALL